MKSHLKFQMGKMHGETYSRFGAIILLVMFIVYRLSQASFLAAGAALALQLIRLLT